MELIVGARLGFERLGVEQEVRHLSSLRSCYRCCGFARIARNRSLASLPCQMAVDSCECQPATLDVSPSNPRRINRLKVSAPPRYLEKRVRSNQPMFP